MFAELVFKRTSVVQCRKVAHRADLSDLAEKMKTLIMIFSNGKMEDHTVCQACRSKAVQSVKMNPPRYVLHSGVNLNALPPPSPFFRRKKILLFRSSWSVNRHGGCGTDSLQVSSPHGPQDEYDTVLDYIMSYRGELDK